MKTIRLLSIALFALVCFSSCEKKPRIIGYGDPIYFVPDKYTISAAGGEVLTSVASNPFMFYGSRLSPENLKDPYYSASDDKETLETDFFVATQTTDRRVKFVVQPNTTDKERTYCITVRMGDSFGYIYLTQTAK